MLARRMARHLRTATALAALALSVGGVSACGSQEVSIPPSDSTHRGAELFASHCAGCHTFSKAGTQGGATKTKDRERVDGPSFDARKETVGQALYAIRNGGFSGAIMPENIVTGPQAQAVAEFLAKYSGKKSESQATPPSEGSE
jgi:mono/diheme cytochrome c family protein